MAKAVNRAMFISKGRSTEKKYRDYLLGLQKKMHEEIFDEVKSLYQKEMRAFACDASVKENQAFAELFKKLKKKWYREFAKAGKEGAAWFVEMAKKQTEREVRRKLKEAGYGAGGGNNGSFRMNFQYGSGIKMQVSDRIQILMDLFIEDNTKLIKNIPQKTLERIQKVTTESFYKGRDIGGLYEEFERIEGMGEVRAATIARDQTNKASQSFAREEARSVGITKGRWLHIGGRKSSRKSHMALNGKIFDLDVGLADGEGTDIGEHVRPGERILCNCTFQPVLS